MIESSARKDKPRLLFLCQTLPYPPDAGVHIRSFNIMRLLADEFEVTALCFYRKTTRSTPEAVRSGLEGLQRFADAEVFPIPQEHSRLRLAWDHLRSIVTRRPYTVYAYRSGHFRQQLLELLNQRQFDLIHLDSLDLSDYLPLFQPLPVACTHHNVESALLRRRARSETSILRAWYLALQAKLMDAEERRWSGRVSLNVAVSASDADHLVEKGPNVAVTVVPNGVDVNEFVPSAVKPRAELVFVGGHGWYPNRDGMLYFAEEILPLIRRRVKDLPVTWIGRAAESVRREYAERYGIQLTGYVDDIRPTVAQAACYVVPLRVGGGSRLKILDAWAMGKALVSTSVGCEGLDAEDGKNVLIRDSPEEFAEAVVSVLKDDQLRRKLERNGRSTVEETYDWRIIGKGIVDSYRSLLASSVSA